MKEFKGSSKAKAEIIRRSNEIAKAAQQIVGDIGQDDETFLAGLIQSIKDDVQFIDDITPLKN